MSALRAPYRRDQARLEATQQKNEREDSAPRLCQEIGSLRALRLKFEDRREQGQMLALSYTKPVVVGSAPATFEIRCMEPRCDGLHDLTYPMLQALRQRRGTFTGESACNGAIGDMGCNRVLAYTGTATYADE